MIKSQNKSSKHTILLLIIFASVMCFVSFAIVLKISAHNPTPNPTSAACQPASPQQIEALRSAIKDTASYNDIGNAYMLRSNDYTRIYFVAAQITGPELDNLIGVWAISGDPATPGLIYAINGNAHQFSGFGMGDKTDAVLTMDSHGAQETFNCLSQ